MAQGGGSVYSSSRRRIAPSLHDPIDPDRPYPMTLPRLGHAVIINNVASEMPGSLRDVDALIAAYEMVGFDVDVHYNCDTQQMRKIRRWIMNQENHVDSNCFALTIICHGNEKGHLLDKNKSLAWMTELFISDLSDVETLVGKPKIIIIQACRGSQQKPTAASTMSDDRETTHILPDKADVFIAYATVPGYSIPAVGKDGSMYLQTLAKYLREEYMRKPLDRILRMVRQDMTRKMRGTSGMMQCPEERNSLLYDVMFSAFYQKRSPYSQRQTETAMATKMRQTEEERRAVEAKMSDRIRELEEKMEEMNKPSQTTMVRVSTDTERFKNREAVCIEAANEAWKLHDAGSYDEALIKVERALEIEEKELGARDEQMARLYFVLVYILVQKVSTGDCKGNERFDILHKVIILSEKAKTIYRRLPQTIENKNHLGDGLNDYVYTLTYWSGLGGDDRLSAEDALDKAKSALEEMISIAQQINDIRLLANAYMKKGDLHRGQEAAIKWYNEALRIGTENLGEKHAQCGGIYYNTGLHHEMRGELVKAYENYRHCYLIYKEIKGDKHPQTEHRLRKLREDPYVQIAKQKGEKWIFFRITRGN